MRKEVIDQCVTQTDTIGIGFGDECFGLSDRISCLIKFLTVCTNRWFVRFATDRIEDIFLADIDHTTRTACGVIDCTNDIRTAQFTCVRFEHDGGHEMDGITRREVLSGGLVGVFIGEPDNLFKKCAHLVIIHSLNAEIVLAYRLDELVQEIVADELRYRIVEVEILQNILYFTII